MDHYVATDKTNYTSGDTMHIYGFVNLIGPSPSRGDDALVQDYFDLVLYRTDDSSDTTHFVASCLRGYSWINTNYIIEQNSWYKFETDGHNIHGYDPNILPELCNVYVDELGIFEHSILITDDYNLGEYKLSFQGMNNLLPAYITIE